MTLDLGYRVLAFLVAYWSGRFAESLWMGGHHYGELATATFGSVMFWVLWDDAKQLWRSQ